MAEIFFTSDHHFGHSNIIKYCSREFSDINHMNEAYIATWNSQVSKADTVYHLGDFTFNDPAPYLSRLNGRIKFVPGNHDKWINKEKHKNLRSVHYGVEILPLIHVLNTKKCKIGLPIVLCHYPMYAWPHSYHGSWHLHGHSHKDLNYSQRVVHVGVDSNHGCLYSLEEVESKMKSQERLERSKYVER